MKTRHLLSTSVLVLLVSLANNGMTSLVEAASPQPLPPGLAATLVGPVPPAPQAALQTTWVTETVDFSRDFYGLGDRSLALDAAGRPHIAYGGDHLYYAYRDGAAWHVTTVDAATAVGNGTSLALDADGHPHISYWDNTQPALKYAYYDGAAWQVETVDSSWEAGDYTALAMDAAGHPHIAYIQRNAGDCGILQYAVYDGATWNLTMVDGEGSKSCTVALALDSAGRPHIGYIDRADQALLHAHYDGSAWQFATVDSLLTFFPSGPSLALDSGDHPHMAYYEYYNPQQLKYAHNDGSGWQTEVIQSTSNTIGESPSLALDTQGHPRIAYTEDNVFSAGLSYAYFDGTAWYTVSLSLYPFQYTRHPSLALDSAGRPQVSFVDSNAYDLNLAWDDGTSWQAERVDSYGSVGGNTSLVLDTAGRPHISYQGQMNLKYARLDGTTWYSEVVDGDGNAGESFTSLALDTAGWPHIAYDVADRQQIRYAAYDGVSWQTQTVTNGFGTGSLALDAAGRPHLGYETGHAIWYAWYDGTGWQQQEVITSSYNYNYLSLALDAAGRPHMISLHYDYWGLGGPRELLYLWSDGSAWHTEVVDTQGGWQSSLALDAAGRPHISYIGGTGPHTGLRYAWRDGSTWHTMTVEEGSDYRLYPSLALDAAGRPHISYCVGSEYDPGGCHTLKYASYDGQNWYSEVVDDAGWAGNSSSLALDRFGAPHISYCSYDNSGNFLRYATPACIPLAQVSAAGPAAVPVGIASLYTVTYAPPTATFPLLTWDNQSVGDQATYTWPVPGTYTVAVTATNACSTELYDTVAVTVFCQPLLGVEIAGPPTVVVQQPWTYTAVAQPITASRPLTFTWDNGMVGPVAVYSWTMTGTYTLTVSATGICGGNAAATSSVRVLAEWPFSIYLPLLLR